MATDAEVLASNEVGPWKEPMGPMFMCPGGRYKPDPCECGFVGEWGHRFVYTWRERKGRRTRMVVGHDEMCPGCGDIERFNLDAEFVGERTQRAKVLTLHSSDGAKACSSFTPDGPSDHGWPSYTCTCGQPSWAHSSDGRQTGG